MSWNFRVAAPAAEVTAKLQKQVDAASYLAGASKEVVTSAVAICKSVADSVPNKTLLFKTHGHLDEQGGNVRLEVEIYA